MPKSIEIKVLSCFTLICPRSIPLIEGGEYNHRQIKLKKDKVPLLSYEYESKNYAVCT